MQPAAQECGDPFRDQPDGGNLKPYAVVFSGGGALGAWEVGCLRALCRHFDGPPRVRAGTSAGGLNAAAFTAGMSVEELGNLWTNLKPENVLVDHPKGRGWTRLGLSTLWSSIKQRPLTLGLGRWKAGAKHVLETLPALFDSSPLRKTLELNLQPRWQAFQTSRASLAVAVTDTDAKQKHYFYHAPGFVNLPKQTWERIGSQNLLLDALMATSAIPLLFPSKGKYVDGGVVRNQPLGAAVKLAPDGECIFILVPHADYLPDSPNVLNLAGRLLEIWLGAGLEYEMRELGTKNIARKARGKPLIPVCLIKATQALDEISGLLAFGKNVDQLIQIGETDATSALLRFNPADPNTWPEEARP